MANGNPLTSAIVQAQKLGIQVTIEDQFPGAWQVRYNRHSKPSWYAVGDKYDEADLLRDLREAIEGQQLA